MQEKIFQYTVIFEPLPEGGFNVVVPVIPEICTFGKDLEEAKAMAKDAIRCFLESSMERGEVIPEDTLQFPEPVKEKITVELQTA